MTSLLALLTLGCAGLSPAPPRFDFFLAPPDGSLWAPKIRVWQAASRLESLQPNTPPPAPVPLAEGYQQFSQELRLELVRRVVKWVQVQSGLYFRSDAGSDAWPTLGELIASGRDDCDGMELLTFSLLRRLGFGSGELYRAVLVKASGEAYHMVTLWFQPERSADPFLLDPSGEVSRAVVRLSRVSGWRPVVIFDESSLYRVEPRQHYAQRARESLVDP